MPAVYEETLKLYTINKSFKYMHRSLCETAAAPTARYVWPKRIYIHNTNSAQPGAIRESNPRIKSSRLDVMHVF